MAQELKTNKYNELVRVFNGWLDREIKQLPFDGLLLESCTSALSSGGKRLRPVLCMAAAEMLGVGAQSVKPFALAIEFVHASSLVHDDLPALDDDDFRRGQPSCHKRFGEAAAVLTGDVLLMRAFGLLVSDSAANPAGVGGWLALLSEAGIELCNGQLRDLGFAGKLPAAAAAAPSEEMLSEMCSKKTGALFRAAVSAPLVLLDDLSAARARPAIENFGNKLGLLFQIQDDISDFRDGGAGDAEPNYVGLLGAEAAGHRADETRESALASLKQFGEKAAFLKELTRSIRP